MSMRVRVLRSLSNFQRSSLFFRLTAGTSVIVGLTAVVWLATSVYFGGRAEMAIEGRRIARSILVEVLQARNHQDKVLMHRSELGKNLQAEAKLLELTCTNISLLRKIYPQEFLGEVDELEEAVRLSHRLFTELVQQTRSARRAVFLDPFEAASTSAQASAEKVLHRGTASAELGAASVKTARMLVFGLGLVFQFLSLFAIARSIARPLNQLTLAIEALKHGDYEQRIIEPSGPSELSALAKAFNTLATDLKTAQTQLLQSQKFESIGTLASGIAHDFNNLLGSVQAYTDLLKKRLAHDSEASAELAMIERSAERGAELSRSLLDFARQSSGKKARININECAQEALGLLAHTLGKSIQVKADLAADLPLIEGDSGQVLQVLMNLALNAKDAMPNGGELRFQTTNISVDETASAAHLKPGRYIRIAISDTGVGIPKSIQHRIFDPFFTTKATGKGTGLGLSVAYGIMKSHGGTIHLESEEGKGARFELVFPAATMAPVIASNDAECLSGSMVLVAHREASVRNLARELLEPRGTTVFTAENGEMALGFFEKNHSLLCAVVFDPTITLEDGPALNRLRAIDPEVPVIVAHNGTPGTSFDAPACWNPLAAEELVPLILTSIKT